MSHTKAYHAWYGMRERCENPKSRVYPDYGGRGIKVCERWQNVMNFIADMGEPAPGMEIDRYPDNNGNYEPGNCRWTTKLENMRNRRSSRIVVYEGETTTIGAVAAKVGVNRANLRKRILDHGERVEVAIEHCRTHTRRSSAVESATTIQQKSP